MRSLCYTHWLHPILFFYGPYPSLQLHISSVYFLPRLTQESVSFMRAKPIGVILPLCSHCTPNVITRIQWVINKYLFNNETLRFIVHSNVLKSTKLVKDSPELNCKWKRCPEKEFKEGQLTGCLGWPKLLSGKQSNGWITFSGICLNTWKQHCFSHAQNASGQLRLLHQWVLVFNFWAKRL